MKIKNVPVKFKTGEAEGLKEGQFLVYPSTFTRTPDSYGDVVAKGAFLSGIGKRKSIGAMLPGLFGHRLDDPDFYVAYAIDEGEDEHGWWVKGEFDMESPKGPQVYRLVKSGRLRELSFAYDVLEGGFVKVGDGVDAYEIRDVEVFEFSFVPVGANRDTSIVAVKSAVDALVGGVTVGRFGGEKAAGALTAAVAALDSASASLKTALAGLADESTPDPAQTGGHTDVKDEGAPGVKSEGDGLNPSRFARANYLIATAL
ncbi:hypothetical protein A9Z40_03100 [Microbacterium arborescens]|uniref:Prohead serine protease domain-containing protein n=1 Tax=Microbacterium arborescens TaxID=33883 RepID=A0ABX2WIR0_9MICO|nr:HK97 family phage prohead protease [Microbacterium arborescens]OAZ40943.1 hypothetical protein A9Z40_03100 [Microbacterium arborescens]